MGDRSNEDKSPVVNAEEDSDAEVCYSTEWETSSNGEDFEDGEMEVSISGFGFVCSITST